MCEKNDIEYYSDTHPIKEEAPIIKEEELKKLKKPRKKEVD